MIELHLVEGGPAVVAALSDAVADALTQARVVQAARLGGGQWEVSAANRVGVASVAGVTVWVRPKVPIARILFMLGYANNPGWHNDIVDMAEVDDLLPAVAQAFVDQAERAVATGLLQGYAEIDDSVTVLRGRIREQEQLSRRFGVAVPLLVRYDDHTVDIAENQLLRAAAETLLQVPGVQPRVRGRLRHLRRTLGEVSALTGGVPLPSWSPTRLNQRYHVALWLADLVLRGNALDPAPGGVRVGGFMVDTAKVYEDFLAVALTRAFSRHGGRCSAQHRTDLDEAGAIEMKPDLVWLRDGAPAAVIDAKYKAEKPAGFPHADMYQLLAYCTALRLRDGHLVYAKGNATQVTHAVRHAGITIHAHTLDLDTPPAALLAQVEDVADGIAAGAGPPSGAVVEEPANAALRRSPQFLEIASWRVVAELVRRHPELSVIEMHPAGGQADELALYPAGAASGSPRLGLNRSGSAHIERFDDGRSVTRPDIWDEYLRGDPIDLVLNLERDAGLQAPTVLPQMTPAALTYACIAELMARTVDARRRIECRNGYLDHSGMGSCDPRHELFTRFPRAERRAQEHERGDILDDPWYRFWFVLVDGEPSLALEPLTGTAWTEDGEEHDLVRLHAAGGHRVERIVDRIG